MTEDQENPSERTPVSVKDLPTGIRCKHPITDTEGVTLVSAGATFSDAFKTRLSVRDIHEVCLHPEDAEKFVLGKLVTDPTDDSAVRGIDPARAKRFGRQLAAAKGMINEIGNNFSEITNSQIGAISDLPLEFAAMLAEDADQAVTPARTSESHLDLAERCTDFSLLAMSTANELGVDPQVVQQVGLAAMVHDFGLFLYPGNFLSRKTPFSDNELWDYQKHGQVCVDVITKVSDLSMPVKRMILQVHERVNGSGFPAGTKGNLLHPCTSILMVVDAYLTLTRPGPGRQAIVPHDAIAFLLHQGARGDFDAATMRAFLCQLTLYPIGSQVELDDGRSGTVVRRSANSYATPIVMVDDDDTIEYIDLSQSTEKILRPKLDPANPQIRLDKDKLKSMSWSDLVPA